MSLGTHVQTDPEKAYSAGVHVADLLLAHGLPIMGVMHVDAGASFAISFRRLDGSMSALRWPVATHAEEIESQIRTALGPPYV